MSPYDENDHRECSYFLDMENRATDKEDEDGGGAVVLAEGKEHYSKADDVFGAVTGVLEEEECAWPLSELIDVAPEERTSGSQGRIDTVPTVKYSRGYLAGAVAPLPSLLRNVAIVDHVHHGKKIFRGHVVPWRPRDGRASSSLEERKTTCKCEIEHEFR